MVFLYLAYYQSIIHEISHSFAIFTLSTTRTYASSQLYTHDHTYSNYRQVDYLPIHYLHTVSSDLASNSPRTLPPDYYWFDQLDFAYSHGFFNLCPSLTSHFEAPTS